MVTNTAINVVTNLALWLLELFYMAIIALLVALIFPLKIL